MGCHMYGSENEKTKSTEDLKGFEKDVAGVITNILLQTNGNEIKPALLGLNIGIGIGMEFAFMARVKEEDARC